MVKSGWSRARVFNRILSAFAASVVLVYWYWTSGPPWLSWPNLLAYLIVIGWIGVILFFMEDMTPRTIEVSSAGVRFRYILTNRLVGWDRLSISGYQNSRNLGLVAVEERLPGKQRPRYHRITEEQARALNAFLTRPVMKSS